MRSLLVILSLLTVSLTSQATTVPAADLTTQPVVKPESTIKPAYGTVRISDNDFHYSIEDEGWFASGNNKQLQSQKRFVIRYNQDTTDLDETNIRQNIVRDAAHKCLELGRLEYPGQISTLGKEWQTSLESYLLKTSPEEDLAKTAIQVDDRNKYSGTLFCHVSVTAINTNAK